MKTMREALDAIDGFLVDDAVEPVEKRRLWDVLSALRGPDSRDEALKQETTVNIRRAAFPLTAQARMPGGKYYDVTREWLGASFTDARPLRLFDFPMDVSAHFTDHVWRSTESLEIREGTIVGEQKVAEVKAGG